MRWKALFDDLEAQVDAADRAELEGEVRDRSRREGGLVPAVDRLRAAVGSPLAVTVGAGGPLRGTLVDAGVDWLLMEEHPGRDVLVPLAAVLAVAGLTRRAATPLDRVGRRLDLRWALRGLARDRAPLEVQLRDGSLLVGTLDRVGADHVDLAEHPPGELRRAGAVRGVRLLPLPALVLLRAQ